MKDKFRVWFKFDQRYLDCDMLIDNNGHIGEFNQWGDVVPTYTSNLITVEKSLPATDKNGTQVFVGDIISVIWDSLNYVVVWDDERLGFGLYNKYNKANKRYNGKYSEYHGLTKRMLCESVVIGNVNQNPELLNRERE